MVALTAAARRTAGAPGERAAEAKGRWRSAPRAGFTLIELAVALAILGLLAATVYLALGGALASVERTKAAQEPYQRGRVARSFLSSALRSTAPFRGLPEDGFVAVDSAPGGLPRDEVTFVALAPGAGAARMQLHLYVGDSLGTPELRLGVRELPSALDSLPPWREHVLSRGVAGLQIEYLGAPAEGRSVWLERWESRIRLPYAVRVAFVPGEPPDPLYHSPLVAQIPAGRVF